jgi:predicted metal-dependent hydrolase
MTDDLRTCLERGIELFNREEFFEAHEVWEDAWREEKDGPTRNFLQGLIQVAAGFVKMQRGHPRGMAALLLGGANKLAPFSPDGHGLNVAELLDALPHWRKVAESMARGEAGGPAATPPLPRLRLRDEAGGDSAAD